MKEYSAIAVVIEYNNEHRYITDKRLFADKDEAEAFFIDKKLTFKELSNEQIIDSPTYYQNETVTMYFEEIYIHKDLVTEIIEDYQKGEE